MSDYLDDLVEVHGQLSHAISVGAEVRGRYAGRVPALVGELWEKLGVGSWGDGQFWLAEPTPYAQILNAAFHNDLELSSADCYVIGYSAFGSLTFWSERHWLGLLDLTCGHVTCTGLVHPHEKKDAELSLFAPLYGLESLAPEQFDDDDEPLFEQAVESLGPLQPGECYGFFPALAMGGPPRLGHLRRTNALAHFAFLAQLTHFTLVDYLALPPREIRVVGTP